jgi:hypothetical protein
MDEPDFRVVYPVDEPITAAVASNIWRQLESIADLWYDNIDDPDGRRSWFLPWLPPAARRRAANDAVWLERWARCFVDLMDRLTAGKAGPRLCRCTGEEMALHVALDELRSRYDAGLDMYAPLGDDPIAEIKRADGALFMDDDVLLLFFPLMDGFEDDPDILPDKADLRPEQWFLMWWDET